MTPERVGHYFAPQAVGFQVAAANLGIALLPGAVGVVDVYSINSSVVVMKIAGKLPMEPGYLLHGN